MKNAFEIYRNELKAIEEAGVLKSERIITTPQSRKISTTVCTDVINM